MGTETYRLNTSVYINKQRRPNKRQVTRLKLKHAFVFVSSLGGGFRKCSAVPRDAEPRADSPRRLHFAPISQLLLPRSLWPLALCVYIYDRKGDEETLTFFFVCFSWLPYLRSGLKAASVFLGVCWKTVSLILSLREKPASFPVRVAGWSGRASRSRRTLCPRICQ